MLQRGMCTCNECRGEVPLDPSPVVIAHIKFRGGVGSPGHVPHNVALWNAGCNQREAGPETSAMWKGRRMEVKKPEPAEPQADRRAQRGPSMQSRAFDKTWKKRMDGTAVRRET